MGTAGTRFPARDDGRERTIHLRPEERSASDVPALLPHGHDEQPADHRASEDVRRQERRDARPDRVGVVDGSEALDCSNPWHDEHGSPPRERGRGEGPTHASGPSRDRDRLRPDRDLWRPHGCEADGADRPRRMSSFSGTQRPRVWRKLSVVLLALLVLGSGGEAGQDPPSRSEESRMWMTVGKHRFAITLTDNAATSAFAAQLPLTLDMSELNGNEKHANLPKRYPRMRAEDR